MKRIANVFILVLLVLMSVNMLQAQTAEFDTVSIYDLQYVPDPGTDDASLFLGDTVVVKGLVMHGPRDLWVGARWAAYIVDPDSFPNPWSGFFIIQHDTINGVNTLFGFVEEGMEVYFTGVVSTYYGFTQMALLDQPADLVPVDILSPANPIPDPVLLNSTDLSTNAEAEQWESMWVRIEDAVIVSNGVSSNKASITDDTGGLTYLDDYFMYFRSRFDDNIFEWPTTGTNINAQGFIRQTNVDEYGINPRTIEDLETLSNPPEISDVVRNPGNPASRTPVTVTATLVDNVSISSGTLHYSVDNADFVDVPMTVAAGDTFSAVIPGQPDGSFVRYFVTAEDNEADTAISPGDTSRSIYFYVIRSSGLTIKDLQYTHGYPEDASGYEDIEVTVQGVITSDSSHFLNSYYIQDFTQEDAKWSGIWVRDYNHHAFQIGDMVEVTGTVEENYGVTRIADVDSAAGAVLISSGHTVEPTVVTTGEIANGGANAEAYESVLVKVENVTVSSEDLGYGEFGVDDGSGEVAGDDLARHFEGSYGDLLPQDAHVKSITAIHYYSYSFYKILPRHNTDIVNVTAIDENSGANVRSFVLNQNYPNPFNPQTTISYELHKACDVTLDVFNILGSKVASIESARQPAGSYSYTWNAANHASGIYYYRLSTSLGQSLTQKMVLLK